MSWIAGSKEMAEIGLEEAVAELRNELTQAMADAEGAAVRFPVKEITLQFQVGVTKTVGGQGGIKFWVLELGSSGQYANQTVHTITVVLGSPVDADGKPIKIQQQSHLRPG
jgi:hypothetical protein